MNEDLAGRLPDLLPRAIAWAEVEAVGAPLPDPYVAEARRVGVSHPERIRVVSVEQLPLPDDPELHTAALQLGVFRPTLDGLTLGYAVFIKRGHGTVQLLRHECRHVAQYERAGGIANFLPVYLAEIVAHGYEAAPLELDAKAHEGGPGPTG